MDQKAGGDSGLLLRQLKRLSVIRFAVAMLLMVTFNAKGQEIEPRAYTNAPVGLNFLIAGYNYTDGSVATDPALPIEDMRVQVHTALFAYARTLNFFGRSAKFDVVQPYAWLSGSATVKEQLRDREVSGFADSRFRFAVNFYGSPALSMKDFINYQQNTIVGASVEMTAPSGQYDDDKLVNIGTNRWSFKPEIGVSKSLGHLTLELAGGIRFYTENNDFFGGNVREQDPLYSLQGHFTYSFGKGTWVAVDGTFYTGGQTTLNGIKNNDRLENSRVGATLVLPVNRYISAKLYFHTGVSVRTGGDFSMVGINWQYRFGESY
jgi:hypothetical protein